MTWRRLPVGVGLGNEVPCQAATLPRGTLRSASTRCAGSHPPWWSTQAESLPQALGRHSVSPGSVLADAAQHTRLQRPGMASEFKPATIRPPYKPADSEPGVAMIRRRINRSHAILVTPAFGRRIDVPIVLSQNFGLDEPVLLASTGVSRRDMVDRQATVALLAPP